MGYRQGFKNPISHMPKLPTRVMWATKTSGEVALLDAHTQLRNPPCFLHHHQTQQHPRAPAHSPTYTTVPNPHNPQAHQINNYIFFVTPLFK